MGPMTRDQFAQAIRLAVEKSGEKRAALADRCGISESGIRAIFEGKAPSIHTASKLLDELGLSLVIGKPDAPALEIPPATPNRKRSRG